MDADCSGRKICSFDALNALLSQPTLHLALVHCLGWIDVWHHAVILAGPLSSEAQSLGLSAILRRCYVSRSSLASIVYLT